MDEELIDLTTQETIDVETEEVVESEIISEDLEQNVETEETVEIIKVETVEEIDIEIEDAVGWVGGDNTRHYSLYGRDEADQHPITAITGLREELNDIEALDVVYSDERNQADYYLWEDENILQENRIGYFVSACSDIDKIKMCTSDNDIFGVTVDKAGFIGAQSDVVRDIKYGLVVTTGIVHVRCESDIVVGDYVISNDYGYAQKNKNGYRVAGRHRINGVEYAEITLVPPIGHICKLSDDVDALSDRVDDAETNIVAAINVANAAYNKASEATSVSEDAIKNALEAMGKADGATESVSKIEEAVSSSNEVAAQAKTIAESAAVSAEAIRNEAVATANDTLASVNDLIKDLEPITTWSDPEGDNTGAEYLTTYIKEGLATKAEVYTVETLTNDNKSAIEKNAESFRTLITSVDKYSVGEYSQSYGLTREQAISILKEGMIYVPTKHIDSDSHSETFTDESEPQWFTPHNHYIWDGSDWIEYGNSVAFFSEEPAPSRVLKYWYIDSDTAPEGYEPRALYIYKTDKWVKVNIFYNNPGNRMVSSISQEVDSIALEITNAQGNIASHQQWLDNNSANIQDLVSWAKDGTGDTEFTNLATIKQAADDAGASVALVVEEKDGEKIVKAASIITAINDDESSITLNANKINLLSEEVAVGGYLTHPESDYGALIGKNNASVPGFFIYDDKPKEVPPYFEFILSEGNPTMRGRSSLNISVLDGTTTHNRINCNKMGGTLNGAWGVNGSLSVSDTAGTVLISTERSILDTSWDFNGDKIFANDIGTKGHFNLYNGDTLVGNLYSEYANQINRVVLNCRDDTDELFLSVGNQEFMSGYQYNQVSRARIYNYDIQKGTKLYTDTDHVGTIYYDNTGFYTILMNPNCGGWQVVTNEYQRISCNDERGHLFNTWSSDSAITIYSDANLKNTITSLSEDYTVLFDNLHPVTYKYNDGISDRLHTGFIAQEVKGALDTANISTKDFAGFVILNQGKENEIWSLRYEEFIALNTSEIQKAKVRITKLENEVATLKEQVAALIKGE